MPMQRGRGDEEEPVSLLAVVLVSHAGSASRGGASVCCHPSSAGETVTTVNASTARRLRDKLREHFGFKQFRPGQMEAVQLALEGHDTLVVMPTGSGKSVCFQLPALELEGTTVCDLLQAWRVNSIS